MHRFLLLGCLFAAVAAPVGWAVSDRLEQDDAFCVACHLDADRPLHDAKMADFHAQPPVNLASAHYGADVGCIDCHRGASFPNRVRVKAVAAGDAFRYLLGRFSEPERMRHPLWDEDCIQCHDRFEPAREDDFHATPDHNLVDFAYRCVECHRTHPTRGVSVELDFLDRSSVLPICRNCHEDFEE